jgi:hypothetical protein
MSDQNDRRVAVIAIHGVGDHQPQEMAKAVARMLGSRETRGGGNRYTAFSESTVCARIERVHLSRPPVPPNADIRSWGPLDALRLSGRATLNARASRQDSTDHVFMEGQLSDYVQRGPEDTWEFLRMESERAAQAGIPKKHVHIYDMFWSDLSGVGQAGFRIFGALYQLPFHLGSVGVNNVAAAAAYFRNDEGLAAKWDTFTERQRFTAFMLALPIGLLNLILAAFAAVLFTTASIAKLTEGQQAVTAGLAAIAVVASLWSFSLLQRRPSSGVAFGAPLAFALAGAVAAVMLPLFPAARMSSEISQSILSALLLIAALLGGYQIARAYERRRPGALRNFRWLLGLLLALAAVSVYSVPPVVGRFAAMALLLRAGEVGFWMLLASWAVFWVAMIGAFLSGKSAVAAVKSSKSVDVKGEEDRARRTNWTARLTIALPATIFLLVTFAAWSGFLHAGVQLLPINATLGQQRTSEGIETWCGKDTFCYRSIPIPVLRKSNDIKPAATWIAAAFWDAGLGFIPLLLALAGLAALISLYAVAPSVADEVLSPPSGADPNAAVAIGEWLDSGLGFMRWAGRLLYAGVFVFPLFMAFGLIAIRYLRTYNNMVVPFAEALATVVGGVAVGVLAFGGRLSKLALGLRTGVRVGLDVDNWLQEHPKGTNPTARICARYTSLLRHIGQWRNEKNEGYDALVIFAHSQGTVITADLLRFLNVEANATEGGFSQYDPALQGLTTMPTYLLTVGCPLQQLYGLRFPYIYGYADKTAPDSPNPADLGLTRWVNAYRTGDYVGRNLWSHDDGSHDDKYDPRKRLITKSREEFAVGPGAHTHYWDKTADVVAEQLDAIIAQA